MNHYVALLPVLGTDRFHFCWFIEPNRPDASLFDVGNSVILPLGGGSFFAVLIGKEVMQGSPSNRAYRYEMSPDGLLPTTFFSELTTLLSTYGYLTTYAALWPTPALPTRSRFEIISDLV
jgi:hypothetical protein